MEYTFHYNSKIGKIILSSDGEYLTGLWFDTSKNKGNQEYITKPLPIFELTIKWLDEYFSSKNPDFTPKYKLKNLTPFSRMVTDLMLQIPFGQTTTYGKIARQIANIKGISKMSSQAVGRAVGNNPICIIIPCHRVIGCNNKIVGYNGGIDKKIKLLENENIFL